MVHSLELLLLERFNNFRSPHFIMLMFEEGKQSRYITDAVAVNQNEKVTATSDCTMALLTESCACIPCSHQILKHLISADVFCFNLGLCEYASFNSYRQ